MAPCCILPNHKYRATFLTSPGEARKAHSFPSRHRVTWPSQITIIHIIQFLCVVRLCFHCHFSKLNFCKTQVPTLQEHTWCWFVSVAGTPPPTPFRFSLSVPGGLRHQRVSGGSTTPSPETLLRSGRQSILKDRGGGFSLWLWDSDNTDPAHGISQALGLGLSSASDVGKGTKVTKSSSSPANGAALRPWPSWVWGSEKGPHGCAPSKHSTRLPVSNWSLQSVLLTSLLARATGDPVLGELSGAFSCLTIKSVLIIVARTHTLWRAGKSFRCLRSGLKN